MLSKVYTSISNTKFRTKTLTFGISIRDVVLVALVRVIPIPSYWIIGYDIIFLDSELLHFVLVVVFSSIFSMVAKSFASLVSIEPIT